MTRLIQKEDTRVNFLLQPQTRFVNKWNLTRFWLAESLLFSRALLGHHCATPSLPSPDESWEKAVQVSSDWWKELSVQPGVQWFPSAVFKTQTWLILECTVSVVDVRVMLCGVFPHDFALILITWTDDLQNIALKTFARNRVLTTGTYNHNFVYAIVFNQDESLDLLIKRVNLSKRQRHSSTPSFPSNVPVTI